MRKFAGLLMTAAIVAGGIAANALAQDTIKIGVNEPLTGAFAASRQLRRARRRDRRG